MHSLVLVFSDKQGFTGRSVRTFSSYIKHTPASQRSDHHTCKFCFVLLCSHLSSFLFFQSESSNNLSLFNSTSIPIFTSTIRLPRHYCFFRFSSIPIQLLIMYVLSTVSSGCENWAESSLSEMGVGQHQQPGK